MTPLKIIATNNTDTSKGTGFIIEKQTQYFLVTAKHVFYPSSTQKDYTLPSYKNSLFEVILLSPNNSIQNHKEALVDFQTKTLLYRFFRINDQQALDIAVLKINNVTKEITEHATPFSLLEHTISIDYSSVLRTAGYPSRSQTLYSITCSYATKNYQEMLNKDSKYFFIIHAEADLKGISGSPIFTVADDLPQQLIGIFVGQNRIHKTLGYAVFSFYIKEIIEQF